MHFGIQPVHKLFRVHEQDFSACLAGIPADPSGNHALSDAGRPDDDDIFMRIQEMQFPQLIDLSSVQ